MLYEVITVATYKRYAPTVLYHHTHWNELPKDLETITAENANLIYLVDRVVITSYSIHYTKLYDVWFQNCKGHLKHSQISTEALPS